jgi:uncharacterized protein (TIGR02231 family)
MKTFMNTLMAMAILFSISSSLQANSVDPLKSQVKEVTVFRQGAVVTRTGKLSVPAGRTVLTLQGLPSTLNGQSLQFSASGDFTILSIQHEVTYLTPEPPVKDIQRLEQRIRQFNKDLQREQAILSATQEEAQIIQLANPLLSKSDSGLSIPQLIAAADLYRDRLRKLKLEELTLNQQIGEIRDTLGKVQASLSKLKAQAARQSVSQVNIAIDAPRALKSDFSLSYLISQASWAPIYDVKVENTAQPVTLAYKATVQQQSGEDWNNALLTLSTGNPYTNNQPPSLQPWWLSLQQAVQPAYAPQGLRKESVEDQVLDEVTVTGYSTPGPAVQARDQATTFRFDIKTPYDVPSNGKSYVVHIGTHQLPADYEYYAAPKVNPYAFLTARVTGWETYRLLPGPANLFFEGTYLGSSQLNPNVATDTMSFSLGRDEGIAISRKKGKKYREKQFIGGKQTKTIAWDIEVRNNKREAIKIVIEDQFPVSTTEDITVELNQSKGADVIESQGKLSWEWQLKAGKRKAASFEYEVKYPKSARLVLE